MPLRDGFPSPKPIEVDGRILWGLPLRIRDLATFEAIAAARQADPLADLASEPVDTYADRLRRAYDMALAGGPQWGEPGCQEAIATAAGVIYFLQAVFRDPVNSFDAEDLLGKLTSELWSLVRRIAYDSDPTRQIEALIDQHIGITFEPDDTVDGLSWGEAAAAVCHALSKTPSEIGDMTLPEVRFILTNGKKEPYESALPGDFDKAEKIQDQRAAFWQGWNSTP